ncbi:amidohydrolase [Plectosphaerella cucumerina]|jgi:imidazolonepropionase-like amidohydrolase|uniref:Amidohydrolase n=1 Tax=Plectosphaerella cucumerina TaxID=40658 RepID=A0A8K0T842_9PEZI|nr:amidohydrolase [Plectosphaerella cucumerina]
MVTEADLKPWLRSSPRRYILTNATIVDVASGDLRQNAAVKLQDGRIEAILDSSDPAAASATQNGFEVIDCTGKFLTPGLIDSHVHLMAVPGFSDLSKAFGNPHDVSVLRQPYVCAQMLHRGFTSVRDCGGALAALREAIEDGVFPGPRLFLAGHALSQAGGHADFRGPHDHELCCGGSTTGLGRVVNGVPECMRGVREEIRTGADFIKIMGSGGVSSPTDRIEQLQFSGEEIRAMVECADNAGTFVTAHAYTPKAIRHCVENGCKGIEHGNFIDEPTAKLLAEKGVYLTPTLVTYAEMASPKWQGYLPPESAIKNQEVLAAGLSALKTANDAGVSICYGTDLLGPLGTAQTFEFHLRSKVLSPLAILRSATVTPARMMGRENSLGQVKAGFEADILITEKNPLEDATIFDEPENVLGVIKEGRIYKSRWEGLKEDAAVVVRIKPAL